MKKTFYLFNPGVLERKDNTLKFIPCADNGETPAVSAQSRYLPVEDIGEFYVFGSLRANSALFNFLGQKDIAVHFFDYYENFPEKCCWHRLLITKIGKSVWLSQVSL